MRHTNDSVLLADLHLGCSHISNLDFSVCSIDENIVALYVAMDNWRVIRMEIDKAFENLSTPTFDDLDIWMLQLADISI